MNRLTLDEETEPWVYYEVNSTSRNFPVMIIMMTRRMTLTSKSTTPKTRTPSMR